MKQNNIQILETIKTIKINILIYVPTIDFMSQSGYNKFLKEENYEKEECIKFNKVPCRKK